MRTPRSIALLSTFSIMTLATTLLAASAQTPPPKSPPTGAPAAPVDAAKPAQDPGALRYGISPALPRRAGTLRLACYNVENLFDDVDDPALSGEFDDAKMATPDERCRAIADAIRAIDADVLCLEEVESKDALRWFRDKYLAGMGYDHLASDDVGYYRGVEQAVLSRHPIVRSNVWPDADLSLTQPLRTGDGWSSARDGEGLRFQRSPLYAQIRTPSGYVLDLFAVHHKAGGKDYAYQREAEALKIISLVKERLAENPDANVAVLGDFNGAPSEKSVKIYLDPAFGNLANAWEERFERNTPRETFVTHASGRVIDYIFMSDGLEKDVVPKSFFVFATLTPPKGWDYKTDPHPAGYASDHRPLVIDLVPEDRSTKSPAGTESKPGPSQPAESKPAESKPAESKPAPPASKP